MHVSEEPEAASNAAEKQQLAIVLRVKDVVERLPCGKGWLLAHLRAWPLFHGRPTHRFAGRTIVFTAQDFETLLESLPVRTKASEVRQPYPQERTWDASVTAIRPKLVGRRGKRDYLKPPKKSVVGAER
jgi:hypothetical protein